MKLRNALLIFTFFQRKPKNNSQNTREEQPLCEDFEKEAFGEIKPNIETTTEDPNHFAAEGFGPSQLPIFS